MGPSGQPLGLLLTLTGSTPGAGTTTQTAKARISHPETTTQTALSRISHAETTTQNALARISHQETATQTAIARIKKVISATQSAVARLSHREAVTQTALGRIAASKTVTITAVSRISIQPTTTQTAIADVRNQATTTQAAVASIGLSQIFVQEINEIIFDTLYDIDKVMWSGAASFPYIGNEAAVVNISNPVTTENFLFQGQWSIDQITWQDLGTYSFDSGGGLLMSISGYSTPGLLNIIIDTASIPSGTLYIRYIMIAKDNQTIFTPQDFGSSQTQFDSRENIQKIYKSVVAPVHVNAGATYNLTVPHNLGYPPSVRAFIEILTSSIRISGGPNDYTLIPMTDSNALSNILINPVSITMDNSAVYFSFTNGNSIDVDVNLHYRIFFDE